MKQIPGNVFNTLLLILAGCCLYAQTPPPNGAFKLSQMKQAHVKTAYDEKWPALQQEMKAKKIDPNTFDIFLRAFKYEKVLEVWMKSKGDSKYQLFKTYDICASSGGLGPKRMEGDGQVPEGFYAIDLFNPKSDYYLSLRVNYPNQSDLILKTAPSAGGAIMVHGNCVTIGCIPITDEYIKELYVLCVEAKNRHNPIYIDIYPCRFSPGNIKMLETDYPKVKQEFWANLKPAYDFFEANHWLPKVEVNKKGRYYFAE